jgi:hypothetical protein
MKYILILFLIIAFYGIGFITSDIIDMSFQDHDPSKEDQYLMIEIFVEFFIAFLIKSLFERYHVEILDPLFKNMGTKTPDYVYTIIPLAFVMGVYQNLKKGGKKVSYLWEKYSNRFMEYVDKNKKE